MCPCFCRRRHRHRHEAAPFDLLWPLQHRLPGRDLLPAAIKPRPAKTPPAAAVAMAAAAAQRAAAPEPLLDENPDRYCMCAGWLVWWRGLAARCSAAQAAVWLCRAAGQRTQRSSPGMTRRLDCPAAHSCPAPCCRFPVRQDGVWNEYKKAEVGGGSGGPWCGRWACQGLPVVHCVRPVGFSRTKPPHPQVTFWTAEDIDLSRDPANWQEALEPGERSFVSSALGYLAASGGWAPALLRATAGWVPRSLVGSTLCGLRRRRICCPCCTASKRPPAPGGARHRRCPAALLLTVPCPPCPCTPCPPADHLIPENIGCRFLTDVELPEVGRGRLRGSPGPARGGAALVACTPGRRGGVWAGTPRPLQARSPACPLPPPRCKH